MTSLPLLFAHPNAELHFDVSAAQDELGAAWLLYRQSTIRHYRAGLDFGRTCYEWREKYKAQGSHKRRGFDHLLENIGIPKTTAYRWIGYFEIKSGLRTKRNEVEDINSERGVDRMPRAPRLRKRTSFHFLLTAGRRNQFEMDIKILGGRKKVAKIFIDFVSRAAFEKRTCAAEIVRAVQCVEDYRRPA